MQLIIHQKVTNFTDWHTAFDNDAESRRNAGLTVLQVWKEQDSDTQAFVLLEVKDRAKAESWLSRSNALSTDDKGTVQTTSAYFLETK